MCRLGSTQPLIYSSGPAVFAFCFLSFPGGSDFHPRLTTSAFVPPSFLVALCGRILWVHLLFQDAFLGLSAAGDAFLHTCTFDPGKVPQNPHTPGGGDSSLSGATAPLLSFLS